MSSPLAPRGAQPILVFTIPMRGNENETFLVGGFQLRVYDPHEG